MTLWAKVLATLEHQQTAVLAIVVESEGSAPGKVGFKMLVLAEGRADGTIGGGMMEARIIQRCQHLLQSKDTQNQLIPQVHHERAPQAHQSGMICAGRQTLLLQPLTTQDLTTLRLVHYADQVQEPATLFLDGVGLRIGKGSHSRQPVFTHQSDTWCYEEPLGVKDTLYIVGGGHVGLAISRIFSHLDFRSVIFDHRPHLETLEDNSFVQEKIIGPYGNVENHISSGDHSFVAIVSAAYTSDVDALESVLRKPVRYVGLMGSKAKIRRIFEELKARGVSENALKRVHAPLGLPIGNRTPEEIAISLAAEVIRIRNAS